MRFRTTTVILLAIGFYACATADGKKTEEVRYSYNRINAAEIKTAIAANAYELIQVLRPNWLKGAGPTSFKYDEAAFPVVYADRIRMGTLDNLKSISPMSISKIEFINSSETATRLGRNYHGGAIVVTTK